MGVKTGFSRVQTVTMSVLATILLGVILITGCGDDDDDLDARSSINVGDRGRVTFEETAWKGQPYCFALYTLNFRGAGITEVECPSR